MEMHLRGSGEMPPQRPKLRTELMQHLIRTWLCRNVISERVPHVVREAGVPKGWTGWETASEWATQQAKMPKRVGLRACGVGYNLGLKLLIGQQD